MTFRILSLDGGGIKGTFTAAVLEAITVTTKRNVAEHFDLITGTSTGGILALGLGLGFEPTELLEFYEKRGGKIFPSTSIVDRRFGWLRQLLGPKHSHTVLREQLTEILGDRKFGQSKSRLVIPTYDAIGGRIFLMKTAHHPRFVHDIDARAVDVALATSAAPTYFAAAKFPAHKGASYVDGGMWANCPVLVGIIEAVSFLGIKLDDIYVLSIGTTTSPFNIARHTNSGAAKWNVGIINLLMEAQEQTVLAQAKLLLGERFHRINATTVPGQFSLDDAGPETISALAQLGRAEAVKKTNMDVVASRFVNGQPAPSFVPSKTVSL